MKWNELSSKEQMKHRTKRLTPRQEREIEAKRKDLEAESGNPVTFAEAKHWYFEEINQPAPGVAEEIAAEVEAKEEKTEKPARGQMTIKEAKLGVTMVLTHGDCKKLGFDIEKMLTKDAVKEVRSILGLPEKPIREG